MSMNPKRKRKLMWIGGLLLVVALSVSLVLYALRQNISLFYTPTQLLSGSVSESQQIRAGGLVVLGSVVRKNLNVQFQLTDQQHQINVRYHGILPDLFREGQGVVVQGHWRSEHVFLANNVLAKHDEKYMPPEVASALKTQG